MKPKNNSWMARFLVDIFPSVGVVDLFGTDYPSRIFIRNQSTKNIFIMDDECAGFRTNSHVSFLEDIFSNYKINPKESVFICKTDILSQALQNRGFKSFSFPFYDILEDCWTINLLQKSNPVNIQFLENSNYNYFCLIRRLSPERDLLLRALHRKNLIKGNFVTENNHRAADVEPSYVYSDVQYENDLSHYSQDALTACFERLGTEVNGVPATANFANYIYINNNIGGYINLAVETVIDRFYPCEKTVLPFFTKRIPLIISSKGSSKIMQDQGFDIFADIINISFDNETSNFNRIVKAVKHNSNVLSSFKEQGFTKDIRKRLEYNFDYISNNWFTTKLEELKNTVESKL